MVVEIHKEKGTNTQKLAHSRKTQKVDFIILI